MELSIGMPTALCQRHMQDCLAQLAGRLLAEYTEEAQDTIGWLKSILQVQFS